MKDAFDGDRTAGSAVPRGRRLAMIATPLVATALLVMLAHVVVGRLQPFTYAGSAVAALVVVFAALAVAGRNAAAAAEVELRMAALRASEARFRRLIEQSPTAVLVQCGGLVAYASPKAMAMFGARSERELVGRPVVDFVHPDHHATAHERNRKLNEEGVDVGSCEYVCVRLDGSLFDAEATSAPYEHDGKSGSLVLVNDITSRRHAEDQRDRFFELSPDLLGIAGPDGRFKRVNPAFTRVLGWSEAELVEQSIVHFIHPDDRAATIAEMQRNANGEPTRDFESRFRGRSGRWHWLSWSAMPAPGGIVYGAARDVTAQREAAAEVEAAKSAAEEASRAKSAFLAAMSHEIRTPMNGVVGMVELLARTPLSQHQADMVRTVSDSAVTLLGVIDNILDFSKIEAGRMQLESAPLRLTELVESVCASLVPVAERQAVDLELFIARDVPDCVQSDGVRLRQVLYNIVGNAIKFSGGRANRRGRVNVRIDATAASPPRVAFRVEDNGIGMSPETVRGLFQAFTQGEASTTRRYGGTGLGLTICKRLCTLMDGDIEVESRPGEGSTFTIALPLELADAQRPRGGASVAGIDCIVVAENLSFEPAYVESYLARAHAQVRIAATMQDAAEAVRDAAATVVVVQDYVDGANALADGRHPIARLDHARLLLIGRAQGGQDIDPAEATVLDATLLRGDALLRAVAVAAGRDSPQATGASCDASPARRDARGPSVADARTRGELVLVAEDDAINQQVILRQLALLGYAAEVASTGEEALRLWQTGSYALLLTDLHMPVLDGYELTARIRDGESGRQRMPIVVLTANALRGEAQRARAAGADDYLTKPVNLAVLGATLDKWLAPGGSRSQAAPLPHVPAASVPGDVDISVLKRLVGDDDATVRALLDEFLAAMRRQWSPDLRDAAAANDTRRIAATAHKVKSAARSVGALAFGDLCAELENACRVGERETVDRSIASFHVVAAAVDASVVAILDGERA